jgi:hypothetical protein
MSMSHPSYGTIVDYSNGKKDEVNLTEAAQSILCRDDGPIVFCEECLLMMARQVDRFHAPPRNPGFYLVRCVDCVDLP